jgi:hypothetical protein
MSKTLKVAGGALLAAVLFAGCKKSGGPEGQYSLDKGAMKAQMQAEIDKMPKEEQGMAQMALAFIDMLDIRINLNPGGRAVMTASAPNMGGEGGEPKVETKEGTWKKENDKILLEVAGQKSLSCTADGKKLECGEGREKMVFTKA